MLQEVITIAEQGDFSLVNALFQIAQDPYPDAFKNKKLSCSS